MKPMNDNCKGVPLVVQLVQAGGACAESSRASGLEQDGRLCGVLSKTHCHTELTLRGLNNTTPANTAAASADKFETIFKPHF